MRCYLWLCRPPRGTTSCRGAHLGILHVNVAPLRPHTSVRVMKMDGKDCTKPKGIATKILAETSCTCSCVCCCSASRATLDHYMCCLSYYGHGHMWHYWGGDGKAILSQLGWSTSIHC